MPIPAGINATVVLVRHGESTFVAEGRFQGRQDPPLSALGVRQAGLVAERLAARDAHTPLPIPAGVPVAVWHSPLSRAASTAKAIADAQPAHVALRPIDNLTEIAQGEWEGQQSSVVREKWAAELAAWRRTPATSHAPGGESLTEARDRVTRGFDEIWTSLASPIITSDANSFPRSFVQGYADPDASGRPVDPWAVAVAHDGIFRVLMLALFDIPLGRFWSFPFNLCSITVISVQDGVPVLRAHNLSEHLAPIAIGERAAAEARGDRRGAL